MAIVAEQGVVTPALLVAVVPSLAVKELRGMLAEDAGEDVQGQALAVLPNPLQGLLGKSL